MLTFPGLNDATLTFVLPLVVAATSVHEPPRDLKGRVRQIIDDLANTFNFHF